MQDGTREALRLLLIALNARFMHSTDVHDRLLVDRIRELLVCMKPDSVSFLEWPDTRGKTL